MATITLHSSKTLDNAAVGAGTAKFVQNKQACVHGAADTLQLPLQCEIGFSFPVVASAAAVVTLAAQSGETLVGDTNTAAAIGSSVLAVKTAATVWTGVFITGGAAVA